MIENLSPVITHQPQMASMAEITYRAWGPVGPAIFFRDPSDRNNFPYLDPMEDAPGRR